MTELNAAQKTALFEQACDAELGFLIEKYGFRLVADNGEEFARLTGDVIGGPRTEIVMGRVYRGRDTAVTFQVMDDGMRWAYLGATLYGVRDGEYLPDGYQDRLEIGVGTITEYLKKKQGGGGDIVTVLPGRVASILEANPEDPLPALAQAQLERYRVALRNSAIELEDVASDVLRGNHDLIREVRENYKL